MFFQTSFDFFVDFKCTLKNCECQMQFTDADFVTVDGLQTLTLGALIKRLQQLKKSLGDKAPVWHVEFGGLTATTMVDVQDGGVVIE